MTNKLTRIDATIIGDHAKLTPADEVYFWREYTSGRDYTFGPGNDLVSNLKKKPSSSSQAELRHKRRVIDECSRFFRDALNPKWLDNAIFVPVPGSKAKDHPDYDDRMSRIFRGIRPHQPVDLREIVVQNQSTAAAHEVGAHGVRPTVDDLLANYTVDQSLLEPDSNSIAIVDDVLTAGVHYKAVHTLIQQHFPQAHIVGLFIARRVFPPEDDGDF